MIHLLEFNLYSDDKFTIVSFDDKFDDKDATDFEVTLSNNDRSDMKIYVNYQLYLEYILSKSDSLKSYIDNNNLNDFESIFNDLQELGFNFGDYLQSWVDDNVNINNIDDIMGDEYFFN